MFKIRLGYLFTVEILPYVSTFFITNFSFSAKTNLKRYSNSIKAHKKDIKFNFVLVFTKCIAIPPTVVITNFKSL